MFIREYLRVFVPLVVMLAIYRAIAVPLIEPTVAVVEPLGRVAVHDPSTPWWNEYFRPGTWQLDQPKMVRTSNGTVLLFGNLDKLPDNRIKLFPLTILIPQKDETPATTSSTSTLTKQRAIVIEAPQGIEIQFREAVDFLGGQLPPVKGGQMIGKIQIFAPPKEGSTQDGMLVETSELRIDRRHIWTTEIVKMKIGRSHVQGRDLSIYLDQDLLASKDQSPEQAESPLNGLDRLELIYVDQVHIDLPDDGLFAERTPGRIPVNPPRPAHAEVHCDGAFEFDFHQSLATLSTKVQLRHQVEGRPQDTFQCDRLVLHFKWFAKPSTPNLAASSSSPNTSEWTIDRIEASGTNGPNPNDPSRWVYLEAPSMNARGQGRSLKIELDRGRIALANHLPGVLPNDSSQVYLQRDSLQVWSPEIEYESQRIMTVASPNSPTNNTEQQQSLGQLWAAGPGNAAVLSEDGDEWRLSWAKSLQLQPDGRTDRLTIDGSANARSERQGRFSADTVDLWLTGLPQDVITQVASQTNGYRPSSILPERMHAAGHVIVHTAQLRAQVTDMKFWFNYPDVEAAKQKLSSNASQTTGDGQLQLAGEPDNLKRQFTIQPNNGNRPANLTPSNDPGEKTSPVASPLGTAFSSLATIANSASQSSGATPTRQSIPVRGPGQLAATNLELPPLRSNSQMSREQTPQLPMNVTGETLVAKLSQTSTKMLIDDLVLSGMVTVTRDQVSPTSPWPLTVTGEQVRMDSSDGGRLDATIVGTPAKFAIGSGSIESTEIRFNEGRQMVWIDQPGSFRIPPEAMQSIGAKSPKASPVSSTGNVLTAPGLIPSRSSTSGSVDWIEPPEIRWQGSMVFDGRVARMDGGVKLNCRMRTDPETIWHIQGVAKEMLVELQEPIAIGGEAKGDVKIANVKLRDNVDLKAAQTDPKGNRRSLDHLEVPDLMFLVPQQQWIGAGPGSLRSRRIGNANPGSPKLFEGNNTKELPTNAVRNPEAELQCLHLTFRGRMEGDMNQELVSFHDRVEALIEPIFSWDQTPDVKMVDRLKMGQTTMMCDQLSVYNTANLSYNQTQIANQQLRRDAAWEVTGAGHVRVESLNESNAFAVIANRAQYVALHSMLRIEGTPLEPAIVEQTPSNSQTASPPFHGEISSGAFNLKTGEADLQITKVLVRPSELKAQPSPSPNGLPPNYRNGQPTAYPPNNNSSPTIRSPRDSYPLQRP